jgi:hypothetical protein
MAIILDKYAIKEVADVMFYELDSKGAPSAPVLYLDTLKTSTLSQSSEVVDARGGKGNVKILSWDTNKELTIEMEDAVYSAKSLGIMFGGDMKVYGDKQEVLKTLRFDPAQIMEASTASSSDKAYLTFDINGNKLYIAKTLITAFSYQKNDSGTITEVSEPVPVAVTSVNWATGKVQAGEPAADTEQTVEFITFDLLDCTSSPVARTTDNGVISGGVTIDIGAEFNSNTYYITGDTYARNVASGKDEFLQFIIPKGKVSAEDVSLTMEADGDPATFSMTVQCLKSESGSMVKLVKYNISGSSDASGLKNKGVASVLDEFEASTKHDTYVTGMNISGTSQNNPNVEWD